MLKDKLEQGENIVAEAKISKAAIVIDWLVLPAVLLLLFLSVCLPILGSVYSSVQKMELIAKALGIEEINFADLVAHMGVAFQLPKFLIIFIDVILGLLIVSWFGWACVKTYLHFGYELIVTDCRILLYAKGEYLESKWEDVKNVFIGQSIWGKLFRYGNVTVHAPRGAVTVKNVTDPYRYRQEFYARTPDRFV